MKATATSRAAVATSRLPAAGLPADSVPRTGRERYVTVLTWAFTLLNSRRVLAYLPTLWAPARSGDASQHSLLTWLVWFGANTTMALWLYEQQARRWSRAAMVNVGNAFMCALIAGVIVALPWPSS